MSRSVEVLGADRAQEVSALLAAGAPHARDHVDADDLTDILWEPALHRETGADGPEVTSDPSTVLSVRGGDGELIGVSAAVVRSGPGELGNGHVRLLVVHPAHRGRGVARDLVVATGEWFAGRGVGRVVLGGEAPVYLWPGVPAGEEVLVGWARRCGFGLEGERENFELDTTFRREPPEGVEVVRVVDDRCTGSALRFVEAHWPAWSEEARRAIERGTLHVAVTTSPSAGTTPPLDIAEGAVVAFCAHSALRTGLVGPLATLPVMRGRGVAAALVSAACVDLMVIGCTKAEIGWVGSEARAFYGRLGARPARRFLHLTRPVS